MLAFGVLWLRGKIDRHSILCIRCRHTTLLVHLSVKAGRREGVIIIVAKLDSFKRCLIHLAFLTFGLLTLV